MLATKILHLLGREGPRTPTPSKYIRFIYNRVILENAAVRAGELSAAAVADAYLIIIIMKVFIKCKRLSVETFLSAAFIAQEDKGLNVLLSLSQQVLLMRISAVFTEH